MSKIVVVGDYIQDKYLFVEEKVNPEHVNPCYEVTDVNYKEGGAANVYNNLISLGADADLICPPSISIKTRLICKKKYICRIDADTINEKTCWSDGINWSDYEYVVVSDYLKGAITKTLAKQIMASKAKVIVDTKPAHAAWFKGAYLLKVNAREALEINVSTKLSEFPRIVVTHGSKGMAMRVGRITKVLDGIKVKAVDTTGAGDTVLATLVWALSEGKSLLSACGLANRAASISIKHLGCYAVTKKDMAKWLKL